MNFVFFTILILVLVHLNKCVLEISDSDFLSFTSSKPFVLVKFETSWEIFFLNSL